MSSPKTTKDDHAQATDHPTVKAAADADNPPVAPASVEILEIDVDGDIDCDPYNRTGQFCVPTFDKRDK